MPYQINLTNGTLLVDLQDGTTDTRSTSLTLVGKNYAGYGEIQNENFVHLLENFAHANEPANKIIGQVWYSASDKKLKFWNGVRWKTTGGSDAQNTPPTGLSMGDFWWDTANRKLYAWDSDNSKFVLVGPQSVGTTQTNLESVFAVDVNGVQHPVIKAVVGGITTFVISATSFVLNTDTNINPGFTNFTFIKQGLTLVSTNTTGVTPGTTPRFFGTATDSDKLGGLESTAYVKSNAAVFTNGVTFDDNGFTVGTTPSLKVYLRPRGTAKDVTLENIVGDLLSFRVRTGIVPASTEIMKIEGITVVPGTTDAYDLGTVSLRWNNVRAKNVIANQVEANAFIGSFNGTATKADTLLYAGDYRSATNQNTPNTIVARDTNGNFSANVITATATSARYADLAERYEADKTYDAGTVVVFGGEKEITTTIVEGDHRVAGVISTAPAYIMNDINENHPPVALRGKVPVKVIGKVAKGDILVSSAKPGHAMSAGNGMKFPPSAAIGKALENKETDDVGVVMVVVS